MKKRLFLLINVLLTTMIFISCSKAPITPEPTEQATPKPIKQRTLKPAKQITLEPIQQPTSQPTEEILEPAGDVLSLDEAQDLLINWCEWNEVSYMPEIDQQEKEVGLYGFLVEYADSDSEWSGATYCYAWVNPSTEAINFEEAGYLESDSPNLYANIPDVTFPTPMRNGMVIPYDWFSPPEYVWGVTYMYNDKSVMKSYQAQLEKAGFIDYGTVQSVESLWQYQQGNDGPTFTIEMYSEDKMFSMNMYIND